LSGASDGGLPLSPRGRKLRDGVILGLCGVVVAAAAGANLSPAETSNAAPVSSTHAAPLPPELPSGAPPGAPEWPVEEAASCHFVDRGFGDYERWRPLSLGRVLVPNGHGVDGDGGFDLLVHFHGAEAVRKQLAPERLDLVIAGIDVGTTSSSYTKALSSAGAWSALLRSIEVEVARATGAAAGRARHIAIASWSAGYGSVAQILAQQDDVAPSPRGVDAVILLDSLHAGYGAAGNRLAHGQLSTFVDTARAAALGGPLFYLTHTDIRTEGYASTSETASFLLGELNVTASPVEADPESPIRLTRIADSGRLFVRGYAGGGKEDHCAQLHLLPRILYEHVLPIFQSDGRP
jgi:hypothetical protein